MAIEDLVRMLFSALLGRDAQAADLDYFRGVHRNGTSFSEIAALIADSPEATQRQLSKVTTDLTDLQNFSEATARQSAMFLRVDDLMASIADAFETMLGRPAKFREVLERFLILRQGGELAGVLRSIAESEEAREHNLRHTGAKEDKERFCTILSIVYRAVVNRGVTDAELDMWFAHYQSGVGYSDMILTISSSEEAKSASDARNFAEWSSGLFVQLAYEIILGRGAGVHEIAHYQECFANGSVTREALVNGFVLHAGRLLTAPPIEAPANDPTKATLFGVKTPVDIALWNERKTCLRTLAETQRNARPVTPFARFKFTATGTPLVSIITSLYRGGSYIEPFLANITSQSIFGNSCELLIIDANSPDGETAVIKKYQKKFPNIRYQHFDTRIGIYEAWNIAVKSARGAYCTNANLDDCRRSDSMELQASVLDELPFVDVVYQDVLYSFEENMPFDDIERFGFSTSLPIVSRYNLMEFNSPHNGPMWRKNLHDDVGLFDTRYKSAGDFDFWVRCVVHGKTFYKINDPHIAYYVNPQGLSTRTDTRGTSESNLISGVNYRKMISPNLIIDDDAFALKIQSLVAGHVPARRRYDIVQSALRKASADMRRQLGEGRQPG